MKTENRDLLGFSVPIVGIVETLAEAITASGSEAAVLKDYVSNVLAHSHYAICRRAIVSTLVKESGIKLKTKNEGTEKEPKLVVSEKDAEYVARLETELGEDVVKSFETAVAAAVEKLPVDYTPGVRGSGLGSTPAKKWLAYYDQLVTDEKLAAFCKKHDIDATQAEDDLKVEVANKVREIVVAKEKAAAQAAMDV